MAQWTLPTFVRCAAPSVCCSGGALSLACTCPGPDWPCSGSPVINERDMTPVVRVPVLSNATFRQCASVASTSTPFTRTPLPHTLSPIKRANMLPKQATGNRHADYFPHIPRHHSRTSPSCAASAFVEAIDTACPCDVCAQQFDWVPYNPVVRNGE